MKLFDEWEVDFSETWSGNPWTDDVVQRSNNRLLTVCVIRKVNTDSIFAGCAVLNPKDTYSAPKAKKVAFSRALDTMIESKHYGKNKALRTVFWMALLSQL